MILGGFDISSFCVGYKPIVYPSFQFVTNSANRKRKLVDLGQNEDKYLTGLQLLMDNSSFQSLSSVISANNGKLVLTSTQDLFFPNMQITSANVSVRQFNDETFLYGQHSLRNIYLELRLLQSLSFSVSGTSAIQSLINRANVDPSNNASIYSPILSSNKHFYMQGPIQREVNLNASLVPPYLAGEVLKWYMTNRTSNVSLLLQTRHNIDITSPQTFSVTISNLVAERDETGFYNISLTLTF